MFIFNRYLNLERKKKSGGEREFDGVQNKTTSENKFQNKTADFERNSRLIGFIWKFL